LGGELGFFLLCFSFGSLLTTFLFLFLDLALSDLLLESLQSGRSGFLFFDEVILLTPCLSPASSLADSIISRRHNGLTLFSSVQFLELLAALELLALWLLAPPLPLQAPPLSWPHLDPCCRSVLS
jgi:hypothetical protein